MSKYRVFLKQTETCFFDGEAKLEEAFTEHIRMMGSNIKWSVPDLDNPLG
ncbi:MAG: hypothetical protein WCH01_06185 [Methylococcaceae bacterium]